MELRGCFYQDRFGYCWLQQDQWYFQAVDDQDDKIDAPIQVGPDEVAFEHDETGQ
jgi:hypothetical protein